MKLAEFSEALVSDSKLVCDDDAMQPEYDLARLTGKVGGKYLEQYQAGTNLVLLDVEFQAAFPTADAVNEALRMLIDVARRQGEADALAKR